MTNRQGEINGLLEPFQRFGINLGLVRIRKLLAELGNPHERVPFIHVAGTNGKGSVCAYLSSVLTEAGYKTGRFISPHLICWNERICINNQHITDDSLIEILSHIKKTIALRPANTPAEEYPTQFEVITAAAWLYFAQYQVDVALMEVGLGGRLDATNVGDRPLASIVTSISREHWQRLGDTLGKIATEKAGVIKQGCPVIVGKLPPEAHEVVMEKIKTLQCPHTLIEPAQKITKNQESWATYKGIEYPLSLNGDIQLHNSAIAIATIQTLIKQGWHIDPQVIIQGMKKTRWQGRLQWTTWQNQPMLIDGAHNVDSAKILRKYVDTLHKKTTWVMGMLSTKDHQGILKTLLKSGDQLMIVPVPDHSSAEPTELAHIAQQTCPDLDKIKIESDLFKGLEQALVMANPEENTIVLCGSLYLLGHFLGKTQEK
ncbi:bifunctional folylpolyglutamate synthase/dihydrofolate synthase [Cyanobacterium sp. IPPAS B-1200]|uniref:bifunctional folylpolyglutamate synthase/dihydrofolate synthase n=1 Tax=Cyanobacterium sp. IPPAS B-1200 TaxID=1562720 RepID=UPI0008526B79|nr:folylpolyglutamate synthase/dihydrofolate synthase family protein [Cyanobacterium sp. IPPAS B-1200]OEJ79430.1 bifunctional folylpolyglutamate synthase/dihydrofolate synthase [Cyanobacterium sp. IPPAS B-1200]